MLRNTWLALGILAVGVMSLAGCENRRPPPPAAPTPIATPPPTPPPAPPPPPTAPAALESLSVNPSTVRSQANPVATVTLTAGAPTGAAIVLLVSNNPDVAKVPSGMTVQAGETTGTFTVDTATVAVTTLVTLEASYSGVTRTAVLTVLPPPLQARFTVVSTSKGADACAIIDAAGSVDCVLDASASDGFVVRAVWTFKVGANEVTQNTTSAVLVPGTTCGFLGGATVAPDGTVPMSVSLQVEDRGGNRSSPEQRIIALFPNSFCGY